MSSDEEKEHGRGRGKRGDKEGENAQLRRDPLQRRRDVRASLGEGIRDIICRGLDGALEEGLRGCVGAA